MRYQEIIELAKKNEKPLVSIYMPTHIGADSQQDPTRLNNLLREANNILSENDEYEIDVEEFLSEAESIIDDNDFWNKNTDGLGILIDSENTHIFRLNGNIEEELYIGEHFDIIPLIDYYELPNDYYFLDLSKDRFSLYSYKDGKLNETDNEIYKRFTDLFDDRDIEVEGSPTKGKSDSVHGYHTSSSVEEKERDKYFRYLADELKTFLQNKEEKLILFGTTENISEFKNMIDFDVYATIEKPFSSIDRKDLYEVLKDNLLDKYIKEIDERIDGLKTEIGQDRGNDDIYRIKLDAQKGKIETLFLARDLAHDDEINRLVSDVYIAGGEVVIVDREYNNFDIEAGANYRY